MRSKLWDMASRCPSCRRAVLPRAKNPCFPFCSDRCRLVDLGKWLGGEYRIPVAPPPESEQPERVSPVEKEEESP
jgi:endogenous inhibitor of DNA gyrase (YacG/DUF329 family)